MMNDEGVDYYLVIVLHYGEGKVKSNFLFSQPNSVGKEDEVCSFEPLQIFLE
jgi:hypothetical protein